VVFNCLGQVTSNVEPAPEPTGSADSPRARLWEALSVSGMVMDGELSFDFTFDAQVLAPAQAQRVADVFLESIAQIVVLGEQETAGALTPSDVPSCVLTQGTLDRITTQSAGTRWAAQDVYTLTPLQEGMLFHHLRAPGNDPYIPHVCLAFDTSLNVDVLEKAFQSLVERHDVLRTSMAWEGTPKPLQVVHKRARFELERIDWTDLAPERVEARLRAWVEASRRRGFDLRRAPLTRGAAIRVTGGYWLVWATHHIVEDGWSLAIMVRDLFAYYEHLAHEVPLTLGPVQSYRRFIDWLSTQSMAQSRAYWKDRLADVREPTVIHPPGQVTKEWSQATMRLTRDHTNGLVALCRELRVTLGTVVHAAWAVVLGSYTGKRDVIFGSTLSGRSAPINDIEHMVGPFINVVPVRVRLADEPVSAWLVNLQDQFNQLRLHEHLPLAEVQALSGVPNSQPLFESMLTFQNYPVPKDLFETRTLTVGKFIGVQDMHYPLCQAEIVSWLGQDGQLDIVAQGFSDTVVPQAPRRMLRVLEQLVHEPSRSTTLLSPEFGWASDSIRSETLGRARVPLV
jgi:hypothetical protein